MTAQCHPQELANLGWIWIKVDTQLKGILEILNQAGYKTRLSCQDNLGRVWIQFDSPEIVRKLLKRSLDHDKKINGPDREFEDAPSSHQTLWSRFFPEKLGIEWKLDCDEDLYYHPGEIQMNVSLRFPIKHLELFEKLIIQELSTPPPLPKKVVEEVVAQAVAQTEIKTNDQEKSGLKSVKLKRKKPAAKLEDMMNSDNKVIKIPGKIDSVNSIKRVLSQLWPEMTEYEIHRLSGLSNPLYHVEMASNSNSPDFNSKIKVSKEVLIRTKKEGESSKTEVEILSSLAKHQLAPKVHARFENGLICDWQPGRTLKYSDLDFYLFQIAKKMADLHQAPILITHELPSFFGRMLQWLRGIKNNAPTTIASWQKIILKYSNHFSQVPNKVVFCHNDLTYENLILSPDGNISFIDFEYAGYNYPEYEIANFFQEWSGNELDDQKLPTRVQKARFIREYLRQMIQPPESVSEEMVKDFLNRVEQFEVLSDFHWGIWALYQHDHPDQTIKFDYLVYGMRRLTRWHINQNRIPS